MPAAKRNFHRDSILTAAFALAIFLSGMPVNAAGRQIVAGQTPSAVGDAVRKAQRVGVLPRSTVMHLSIGLPLRNPETLEKLLKNLSDPTSPSYRVFLTPEQFAERFGPTEDDYQALVKFAVANGLTVSGTHPNRTILDVTAPVTEIERVFHVNVTEWKDRDRGAFYAPDREPSIDFELPIQDITGLDNFVLPRPMNLKTESATNARPLSTGSGPANLYIGTDFRHAYAPGVTMTGVGQSVGLLEFDGFFSGDVTANFKQAGLPAVPVQTVLLDGYNGVPGGNNIEVILDIMMASYMAPGVNKIIVYEGYYPNDVLNRMATDNLASQLSSSWTFSPINTTTENIFKQMVAQGQSLLQASGDSGAYNGPIATPADDPNLTVVGGTSLTTAGAGGPWQSEATWSGSGGGVSTTYPIPSYQSPVNMAAVGGSTTMRNIPDVALTADIQMFLVCNNGQQISVGGTSAAAPLWAGFIALANQAALANQLPAVGFLNPLLYTVGTGANYSTDMHDIVSGNNYGFSALPGYDLTTGWGSPAGQHLINDLTSLPTTPTFNLTSSPNKLSIIQGAAATSVVTVSPLYGFSGTVVLTASGLPTGVTASFSPLSNAGVSTLSLTAGSAAAIGTAAVTITGVSGAITVSSFLNLTVSGPPNFGLSLNPTTLSINQGASGTAAVTITPQNGFTGSVMLSISGLPAGVTATLSPSGTANNISLALTATSSAAPRTAAVTITGTSSTLSNTAILTLTVAVPPTATYSLSAAPATMSILPGATGISTITVVPLTGFTGKVNLVASGMPTGITATLSSASTATTSRLTLSTAASTVPGTFPIVVTGTSGSMTSAVTVKVTITAVPSYTLSITSGSLTLPQATKVTDVLSVVPVYGFNLPVSLAASGLPTGVTAAFSPASATTTSTLTLTASATAVPGTASVVITGTSGSLTSSVTVVVTVPAPPNYTLSSSSSSGTLLINEGGAATSTIAVAPLNGFAGSVNLAISGLPAGVTALFSPASTSTASVLTLSASNTATVGKSTLTVTGTSGVLSNKITISLTVSAPSYTLSASSGTMLLAAGSSATSTITVAPLNGFASNVSLVISGLPTGITATLSPASTSSLSVLTLLAGSTATIGKASLTVTGTSGGLSNKTTIALTVSAPADFSLTTSLASLAVLQGTSGSGIIAISPLNNFTSPVTLVATGIPAGVTANFSATGTAGANLLTFTVPAGITPGTFAVTITGTSGNLSHTSTMSFLIVAPTTASVPVNMSALYNVLSSAADGVPFPGGGIDGVGGAYSGNLLGASQTFNGASFVFGPMLVPSAISGATVPLPAGQFASLKMLATAIEGNQAAQTFLVTYTDGTTSSFSQGVSDWFTPQNYTGEVKASTMAYRDTSTGDRDRRTFQLYEYSFTLNSSKPVLSIALPHNTHVVVLAMTLLTH